MAMRVIQWKIAPFLKTVQVTKNLVKGFLRHILGILAGDW